MRPKQKQKREQHHDLHGNQMTSHFQRGGVRVPYVSSLLDFGYIEAWFIKLLYVIILEKQVQRKRLKFVPGLAGSISQKGKPATIHGTKTHRRSMIRDLPRRSSEFCEGSTGEMTEALLGSETARRTPISHMRF